MLELSSLVIQNTEDIFQLFFLRTDQISELYICIFL